MNQGVWLKNHLLGHQGEIYRIRWSPSGQFLATPSKDKTIRVWPMQLGKPPLILTGHTDRIYGLAWSPDSKTLVSTARDKQLIFWNISTGQMQHKWETENRAVYSVAWSPDGQTIATASHGKEIWLWDVASGKVRNKLEGHSMTIYSLAWSKDGKRLASGSHDRTIKIWNNQDGELLHTLQGHTQIIYSLAWSEDGKTLVSGSEDKTIRVWDVETAQQKVQVEGHTKYVTSVGFSPDEQILASKSGDNTVRLWRTDTWETVAVIDEPRNPSGPYLASLAANPVLPLIATLGDEDTSVRIWELNVNKLLSIAPTNRSYHYTNAKVVLVGDTGVGKSALSLVLIGKPYRETESTHNRRVEKLATSTLEIDPWIEETREILLWDLAGQPGYRLIHQLHLDGISVALVVFDARNEVDPFGGAIHWARVLRHNARRNQTKMKMFLVAARVDRGGVGVSRQRINDLMQELGFDGYFETSAREGWQINEVVEAVHKAIDWSALPKVSSTVLFKTIKEFILSEKKVKRYLSTVDNLYYSFLRMPDAPEHSEDLRSQFDTCIRLLQSQGLVEVFSFGDVVLLKPELLDSYAASLINAAKNEPDGLGSINEDIVRAGAFPVPSDERLKNKEQEQLLIIATIENLMRHEIALRTPSDDGVYLVFPSQLTRERLDYDSIEGKTTLFRLEGAISNIYATLVVRLSRGGFFRLKDMWKNAVTLEALVGGTCGLYLSEMGEGRGELTLFFGKNASPHTRFQFEEYVHAHLRRRASQVEKESFSACPECKFVLPMQIIMARRERNFDWVSCPVCGANITLTPAKKKSVIATAELVLKMDKIADMQRDIDTSHSVIVGKKVVSDYDVFLCHNRKDKPVIKRIGAKLKERSLLPWLDEWELRPGIPWQPVLEQKIQNIKSAAVFVGADGIGPWQNMELAALIRQFVNRECPVIPVILPGCETPPELPMFLGGMTWVDFRKGVPDPLEQLIWGITGERDQILQTG